MEMRFKESRRSTVTSLQKQMLITENRKPGRPEPIHAEPVPDLTELMNDWFFGTPNNNHKVDKPQNNNNDREIKPQNIIAGDGVLVDEEEDGSRYSPRNNNSRLTQEWLQEAKRVVAASPGRCDSPSRLVGSPRFASGGARDFDRRDPLSRSARRYDASCISLLHFFFFIFWAGNFYYCYE
ncbi:hypothetical protein IFM89_017479 [Coptis chinensis]|uniref:Uncharacterized protein n=1 Tax=Coptis chinensis TaxID=261450 RepID=A0A835HT57_9MAGN|nr:hypothetical protein IFM89_017479 [Coptis chinensis]